MEKLHRQDSSCSPCERERGKEKEKKRERERDKERERKKKRDGISYLQNFHFAIFEKAVSGKNLISTI